MRTRHVDKNLARLDLASIGLGQLRDLMGFMTICEVEISEANGRAPGIDFDLYFNVLCPPIVLRKMIPDMYRSHVRELLGRIERREDLTPGTKAEVLAFLSIASLKRPPGNNTLALAEYLYERVLGKPIIGDNLGRETYPGERDEMLAECRRLVGRCRLSEQATADD